MRSRAASPRTSSSPAAARRRSPASSCERSSGRATTSGTSATRGSRAPPTATSRRPIRRYPDLVVHRALLHELGLGDDTPPDDLAELAEHASDREREAAKLEYLADEVCLAWLLEDRLREHGWDEPWPGEITGLIGSGLFVRFGEVFEGFLPARKLPGEFFEVNPTGTALVGRRSGRTYRLGDPIEVRIESIARGEGKVELSLARAEERSGRRG